MNKTKTERGFALIELTDYYDKKYSIQQSSLATEDTIWFGIDDPEPQIMASRVMEGGTGWVKYIIPEDVLITTRMHLSREEVKEIIPILQKFVDTGGLE